MYRRLSLMCLFLALVWIVGCGGPNKPKEVSVKGTVTLDGQPMAEGEISIGLPGLAPSIMEIKAGAFAGTATVGKNRVEIRAFKPGPPLSTDPTGTPPKVNYLPAKYNDNTTLDADVTAGGPNDFKFAVTSK